MDKDDLQQFMRHLVVSVSKCDELLGMYEELDNKVPGGGGQRLHDVVQNSVHLASQIKGGANVTIGAVGRWLERSHHQLGLEESMLHELDATYSDVRNTCIILRFGSDVTCSPFAQTSYNCTFHEVLFVWEPLMACTGIQSPSSRCCRVHSLVALSTVEAC